MGVCVCVYVHLCHHVTADLLIAADQEGKPAMFWRKKGDEWEPSPEDLEGVEDEG